jgi:IS1 family transposase
MINDMTEHVFYVLCKRLEEHVTASKVSLRHGDEHSAYRELSKAQDVIHDAMHGLSLEQAVQFLKTNGR